VSWKSQATTFQGVIEQWWQQWPDANIGVATGGKSGVIVLDVDMKKGKNGEAELRKLEAKHGALPPTIETITPHGGRQLWFLAPGFVVANSVDKLAPGLDIRGDGGYVLAPPSYVSDEDGAGIYVRSVDSAQTFASAPEWVFPKAEVTEIDQRRPAEYWHRLAKGVPDGYRNDSMPRLAGYLLRQGIDPQTTLELMLGWNLRCTPPEDEKKVVSTVESIALRELERRRKAP
jgi:Bifunctional DNA primase/polymerase, N-terminal/Primase C terminal 1 (PriCT-1)